jgi:hypothetical protein
LGPLFSVLAGSSCCCCCCFLYPTLVCLRLKCVDGNLHPPPTGFLTLSLHTIVHCIHAKYDCTCIFFLFTHTPFRDILCSIETFTELILRRRYVGMGIFFGTSGGLCCHFHLYRRLRINNVNILTKSRHIEPF